MGSECGVSAVHDRASGEGQQWRQRRRRRRRRQWNEFIAQVGGCEVQSGSGQLPREMTREGTQTGQGAGSGVGAGTGTGTGRHVPSGAPRSGRRGGLACTCRNDSWSAVLLFFFQVVSSVSSGCCLRRRILYLSLPVPVPVPEHEDAGGRGRQKAMGQWQMERQHPLSSRAASDVNVSAASSGHASRRTTTCTSPTMYLHRLAHRDHLDLLTILIS